MDMIIAPSSNIPPPLKVITALAIFELAKFSSWSCLGLRGIIKVGVVAQFSRVGGETLIQTQR